MMEFNKKGILGRAKQAAQQSATATVTDEGLRAYMLKVYNYMATGILLTGIIALITFTFKSFLIFKVFSGLTSYNCK